MKDFQVSDAGAFMPCLLRAVLNLLQRDMCRRALAQNPHPPSTTVPMVTPACHQNHSSHRYISQSSLPELPVRSRRARGIIRQRVCCSKTQKKMDNNTLLRGFPRWDSKVETPMSERFPQDLVGAFQLSAWKNQNILHFSAECRRV